jgi:hypothetical protein
MKKTEQLLHWLKGESVHGNECCPDFSCCQPHLQAPETERIAFYEAYKNGDDKTVNSMLFEFLGRAFSSPKTYVSGYKEPEEKEEDNS